MSFVDALNLLLRRWLVVIVGLLLLAVATLFVLDRVDTQHQASSQMLFLLPPEASGVETPSNPYLNLQDGLTTTASLVAGTVSSKDVQREMEAAGYDSEYSIALVPGAGPLLLITTTDTSPEIAVATRDELMARVDDELARIQGEAGVPERQWISASRSNVSRRAEVLPGSKMRALAAVYGGGLLLVLLSAFAVDQLLARRRRRKALADDRRPSTRHGRTPSPPPQAAERSDDERSDDERSDDERSDDEEPSDDEPAAAKPTILVSAELSDAELDAESTLVVSAPFAELSGFVAAAPDVVGVEATSAADERVRGKGGLLDPVPLKKRNQRRPRVERQRQGSGHGDRIFDEARQEAEQPGLAAGTARQ